jgi:hypothetical protein
MYSMLESESEKRLVNIREKGASPNIPFEGFELVAMQA